MYEYLQYIIITGLITIWTKKNIESKKRCNVKIGTSKLELNWFMEWLFFSLLAACRRVDGTVGGADSENYVYAFLHNRIESSEFLFYKLNDFILLFTRNYHVYLFIIYGIIVWGILYFAAHVFKKDANIIVLFLYFNIYVTSFGVMRQWIGIAVGLVSVVLAIKRRYWLSIVLGIIAIGFHFTLLVYFVLLIVYFAFKKQIERLSDKYLLVLALACNLFFYCIRFYFISFISNTEYRAYVKAELLESVSWIGYIPTIFFLIICFIYMGRADYLDEFSTVSRLFLFAHLGLIFATVALGMFRFQTLFMPFRAYAMCKVRNGLKNEVILGKRSVNRVATLFDIIIVIDAGFYMWRTIENHALPYIFDISSSFNHIPYYIK